eukprot:1662096-Pleurochrysis_carterae.AAC.3
MGRPKNMARLRSLQGSFKEQDRRALQHTQSNTKGACVGGGCSDCGAELSPRLPVRFLSGKRQ